MVRHNGTVQFTFVLVSRLNIAIVKSYSSFAAIFVPCFLSLELQNELKKHVRNVAEIKYGLVRLVAIFNSFFNT